MPASVTTFGSDHSSEGEYRTLARAAPAYAGQEACMRPQAPSEQSHSSEQDSQSNNAAAEVDTTNKGSPDFKAKEAICARVDSVCTVSLLGS